MRLLSGMFPFLVVFLGINFQGGDAAAFPLTPVINVGWEPRSKMGLQTRSPNNISRSPLLLYNTWALVSPKSHSL